MPEVRVAPEGVNAHELECPSALGDRAVATDNIRLNGMVEVNNEAVEAVNAWTGGDGDHNIVDADVAVEDVAIDQQGAVAADSVAHGKEKLNGVNELVDGLSGSSAPAC